METVRKAAKISGGITLLAKKLGEEQATVSHWIARHSVPSRKIYPLCELVNFQITPEEVTKEIYEHHSNSL